MTVNPDVEPDREKVFHTLVEVITEILPAVPADRVSGHLRLADLGADSVDRVEIVMGVLDRLGLDAPMAAFATVPDLDAMTDLLADLLTDLLTRPLADPPREGSKP